MEEKRYKMEKGKIVASSVLRKGGLFYKDSLLPPICHPKAAAERNSFVEPVFRAHV